MERSDDQLLFTDAQLGSGSGSEGTGILHLLLDRKMNVLKQNKENESSEK